MATMPARRTGVPMRDTLVTRSRSVAGQVFSSLRRDIITGAIVPGTQISEQILSERYGVSRTPIREAMLRLSEEGLVTIFPQVGTFVTRIDLAKVREAQFIREALECATARAAAAHVSSADKELLDGLMARQYRAAKANEHEEFYLADEELHAAVAAISGNPRAWVVALAEKVQIDRVRYLDLDVRADLADLARQHQAILDAIIDRDEHLAEATMRAHLRNVYRSIEQLTTSHHMFFEGVSTERPSPTRGSATHEGT